MEPYLVLLRGINVGGRNKVPMQALREQLSHRGYGDVSTYIASGNVFLSSADSPDRIGPEVESVLTENFNLDDELVRVLVLDRGQLQGVIENRPEGFGDRPDTYHSDAIFLMGIGAETALPVFRPREGVDAVWPGEGVIYSQRLSAERTKSRLSAIMASPLYKSMTIRSWNTTMNLWDRFRSPEPDQ